MKHREVGEIFYILEIEHNTKALEVGEIYSFDYEDFGCLDFKVLEVNEVRLFGVFIPNDNYMLEWLTPN